MSKARPNRADRRHPEQARRRQLITILEAAGYLGVTERTVRQMIFDGRLRAYRLNPKFIRLDLNEINDALKPVGGAADAT
jgi:excisionase family DNA binding protein